MYRLILCQNIADITKVFKMAKGWSAIPLESTFQLSTAKHLRGTYSKWLNKHGSNLELRRNIFTERLINRWNSLDQFSHWMWTRLIVSRIIYND